MKRSLFLALIAAPAAFAQSPVTPAGHWEGSVTGQDWEVKIELDFARNAKGDLIGSLTSPAKNVKGLPLARVTLDGRTLGFAARTDQGFTGTLSDDGRTIKGDFAMTREGMSFPFTLTRTGEPHVEVAPKNARVGKELEGSWTGVSEKQGSQAPVSMVFANESDGTSSGRMVIAAEGDLTIPLVVEQDGKRVTVLARATGGTFSGTLSPDGTELNGTWTDGTAKVAVTFRRAAGAK